MTTISPVNPGVKTMSQVFQAPIQGPGLGYYGDTWNSSTGKVDNTRPVAGSAGGGGGGGGGGGPRGFDPTRDDINSPEWASYRAGLQADAQRQQEEYNAQIDSVYNPQFDYLNQTEQFYKNQLPGYQAEAGKNYDVNKQLLGTSLTNAQTGINTQETTGKRATEDAMAKARRVFMEQQIGNQQRFGGSSSAGGAMSELLARNLQSEQGQIGRQATDYTQQIGQLRQQAQQKFDDSVLQLEQQKQKALNDIQREFDQKMMEIGSNRTQLTSAKAQMKLQALMDLRNQTFAVQQQEAQFKQALQMQLAESGKLGQAGVGTLDTLQNPSGLDSYGLPTNFSSGQTLQTPTYIGSIGKSVTGKDKYGNYTYSDGTSGPGGFRK